MGDVVLDSWCEDMDRMCVQNKAGGAEETDVLDIVATSFSDKSGYAIAVVNKEPAESKKLAIDLEASGDVRMYYISGKSTESYNDIDREDIVIQCEELGTYIPGMEITLKAHMAGVIQIGV